MKLIIDLSKKDPCLILKEKGKAVASHSWPGLYLLSKTLLSKIDAFLKGNKIKLGDIERIEVEPSKESIVSTRIAKAVALGLKAEGVKSVK